MANLLGTIVAGAQALDYALQFCDVIEKVVNAAGNKKRYQQTSQQLIGILQQIRASPHLQTPEILNCTKDLMSTVDDVYSTLSRRRRNRLVASIAFVIKQKNYDDIFTHLEHQKATLALHISHRNTNTLGDLTITSNDIWAKVQSFQQKSLLDARIEAEPPVSLSSTSSERLNVETSNRHQRNDTDEFESLDSNSQSFSHLNDHNNENIHSYRTQLCLTRQGRDSSPGLGTAAMRQQKSLKRSILSLGGEREQDKVGMSMTQNDGGEETQQAYALAPSNVAVISDFEGNIQTADTYQIVGMQMGPNTCMTDADLIRVTSSLRAHGNKHTGKGMQVIGQRVCAGAEPRRFAGRYCDNIHEGVGEQIIGFSFE
ncbi:hypothetical protein F5Y19DRAFT_467813 [Xylariaceae sp. FL1651]|nr:hypothetical protein F5Y19DRAFT_467813 [Xylariaceae sp. FL1651]